MSRESIDSHERDLRLQAAIESEGLGPSVWRERDCITLAQAVIRALSPVCQGGRGRAPVFGLPAWIEGLTEQETILRMQREHGSMRKGWIELLDAEPLLRRVETGRLPAPGMIALTPARGFGIDRESAAARGPLLGVIGPDCALWVRTHEGLRRAHPAAALWEVA